MLIITKLVWEAAGVELFRVLTTGKLLIPGTAKKAPLPDPLYVHCTRIFSHCHRIRADSKPSIPRSGLPRKRIAALKPTRSANQHGLLDRETDLGCGFTAVPPPVGPASWTLARCRKAASKWEQTKRCGSGRVLRSNSNRESNRRRGATAGKRRQWNWLI
jgi:hypothetical protein